MSVHESARELSTMNFNACVTLSVHEYAFGTSVAVSA